MPCLHPKHIEVKNVYPTKAYPEHVIALDVPCGHCLNCLKHRQTDYSTRIYREASKGLKMYFVTFTYRDDTIPLAKRLYRCDKDTGELEVVSNYEIETDSDLLYDWRGRLKDIKGGIVARYIDIPVYENDSFSWICRVTPSLNRLNVRSWLKQARIQYKRDNGKSLPKFSYAFCGEYGGRTSRPHYHALFFGLDMPELSWMLKYWNDKYGYTFTREVPILNPDGTDARLIVSRYVGKYISKGKFDLDSVKAFDCEKGRLCNSKRLGTRLTDAELSYFRCYDLYGEYSLHDPEKTLSAEQITEVAKQVVKRSFISLPSKEGKELKLPLPKAIRNHIWCYPFNITRHYGITKSDGSDKVKMQSSPILRKVADLLRAEHIREGERIYKRLYPDVDVSEICPETFARFFFMCKNTEKSSFEDKEETLFRFKVFSSQRDNQ